MGVGGGGEKCAQDTDEGIKKARQKPSYKQLSERGSDCKDTKKYLGDGIQ